VSAVAAGPTPERLLAVIRAAGVRDVRVLAAIRRVPRERFVPPGSLAGAYWDEPVPIPHGQVTTQPSLVARMVAALRLRGAERVLEVGTGYGWQTALLAELAQRVWSVERFGDVALAARANLERHGAANAEVVVGDGSAGLPERAPFDAVVVSAAYTEVPAPLAAQLAPGGRLVIPLGPGGDEDVVLFERSPDGLERRASVARAHFVRLHGRYGFAD
jgi:protein-L-isoaspartate(D-aspartate) O-methyltransferase